MDGDRTPELTPNKIEDMKAVLKDYLVPILTIVGIAGDLLLRFYSPSSLSFLIKPLFSINILEIILAIFIAYLLYKIIPSVRKRIVRKNRASRLFKNWQKFKHVLVRHQRGEQMHSLQQEYAALRESIEKDFNYFLNDIIRIQRSSHRNYNDLVLRNFEKCWSPRNLSEWRGEVAREIPKELDCFDYILVGLVEEFK